MMLKWLWISLLVIVLDQITKFMASDMLILYQPVPVIPMFNLTLMHNPGAAFSFLSEAGGWQRWFFTVIALGVSTFLVFWLKRLSSDKKVEAMALVLIIGGALGNLIDRLWLGYVVDFIQVYYDKWYFPAFNIADSAITIGAILIIYDTFRAGRAEQKENETGSA